MPSQPGTDARAARRSDAGASLLEILVCLAVASLVAAAGWQALIAIRDERAGREAARGVASTLREVALEAQARGRSLAVEFDTARGAWRVLMDGNANGVSGPEVAAGIDPVIADWAPVLREGRGRLAITRSLPGLPGEPAVAAGSSPVRLGVVSRLTFTPRGTSGSGTIHVAGPGDRAYMVRILGNTQRVRLHCLREARWEAC